MSLRARLAWTYGAAVFVAVLLLAVLSLAGVDRSLRSSLDARLSTAALASTGLVDVKDGRVNLDPEDEGHLFAALPSDMEAAVYARNGDLYTSSASHVPQEVAGLHPWRADALVRASAGEGDREVRVAIAPVVRGGVAYGAIVVWQGSDYIDEFDRNAIIAMAFVALLIGGIVVVFSSTLAHRALAPLEHFIELATEIEAHDLSRRVGSSAGNELGRLGSAFDRMLDRLEAAFGRQRRFTADASHELRAPLAVIRAEADVALAKDRTSEQYRAALHTIVQEVDRIDALVDGLLVAARADSAQLNMERVDAGSLALLTVSRFTLAALARGIDIVTNADDAPIEGDSAALERALAAILHNAVDFAVSRIVVGTRRVPGGAEVSVEDDGPGFSQEGLRHATERFWRADPARTRGGTGLGLSIAEAIVRAHGGRLQLTNVIPHGARITLYLPFIAASSATATLGQ